MSIIFFDSELCLDTLFPLFGKVADLPLTNQSLKQILFFRWSKITQEVTASIQFWISDTLLNQIIELNGKHWKIVSSSDSDILLAWSGHNTAPVSDSIILQSDEQCVYLQYPWDYLRIHELVCNLSPKTQVMGKINTSVNIDGVLILGNDSEILPGVYIEGVVVIGDHCKIGPNCYIRGSTSIGHHCHIGNAVEIKNSILMNHVSVAHLSYVGDSILSSETNFGAGTIISNFRHDACNHHYLVNGKLINTNRQKFGAVIGNGVHTGIHTSIYPGRFIGPHIQTLPGEIVKHNLS